MARLLAFRPGVVVAAVDLGYFTYRLEFAATPWEGTQCLSLVYAYPPSPAVAVRPDGLLIPLGSMAVVALLRLPVHFAKTIDELAPVARTSNECSDLEIALKRTTEAFMLFNNNGQIKRADIDAAAVDACKLVTIAWDIRAWMMAGMKEEKKWDFADSVLIGQP